MKVERLRTESQHIEYIDTMANRDFCHCVDMPCPTTERVNHWGRLWHEKYMSIVKWADILKQPLTEDMLFNSKPQVLAAHCHDGKDVANKILQEIDVLWQEAEKKVIFKCVKKVVEHDRCYDIGEFRINFRYYAETSKVYVSSINTDIITINTLSDLAAATESKLLTQNLEV